MDKVRIVVVDVVAALSARIFLSPASVVKFYIQGHHFSAPKNNTKTE